MKKFRLTVTIGDFVIYQALYCLDENQYKDLLASYGNPLRGGPNQFSVLETLTGAPYSSTRDYAAECPDFVICMLICERVSFFGDEVWRDESPILGDVVATTEVEHDEREGVDWMCVPVEQA